MTRLPQPFDPLAKSHRKNPRGLTVGLLGGSFNPAHDGHRHISNLAIKRLGLDQVWWLVSPQNPLKPAKGMASFDQRFAEAAKLTAKDANILVSDIECRLNCRHTVDTLKRMAKRYPGTRFVWLMGADNLIQISRWKDWTQIFETVSIAVFARPSYSIRAMASQAARRFADKRIPAFQLRGLAKRKPPAWVFLWTKLHAASSTEIRRGKSPGRQ